MHNDYVLFPPMMCLRPAAVALFSTSFALTLALAGDAPGPNASLDGKQILPPDNPWNRDISRDPVDPNSTAILKTIGLAKGLHADFGTTYDGVPTWQSPMRARLRETQPASCR